MANAQTQLANQIQSGGFDSQVSTMWGMSLTDPQQMITELMPESNVWERQWIRWGFRVSHHVCRCVGELIAVGSGTCCATLRTTAASRTLSSSQTAPGALQIGRS